VHLVDPGDPLDADHSFVARLVRQPGWSDQIADRIDTGLPGAQPFIDDDMGPFDDDTGVLKANILDVADDANSEDDPLDLQLAPLPSPFDARRDTIAAALQGGDRHPGMDLDPLLFERLAGES